LGREEVVCIENPSTRTHLSAWLAAHVYVLYVH
jgi:hypothetical protein